MRPLIFLLFILTNFCCYAQGFNVSCSGDTVRGNHGGYENDELLTFCAYRYVSSDLIPKRLLEINDSIINMHFGIFFKTNDLLIRDYLLIDNSKFDSLKTHGMGWLSLDRCDTKVTYAIRYEVWIYGNIRYFLSMNYDSLYNCLNLETVANFCTYFDKSKLADFCSIKETADKDFTYKGKVKEVTFAYNNNQFIWEFEKDGPGLNKKTLRGYNYMLTYNAYTGKLIQRSKRHYQSCAPCPANFW